MSPALAQIERIAWLMSTSLRLMLLGIALLLFGLALPDLENGLLLPFVYVHYFPSRAMFFLLDSAFPIAGIILVFVGFFRRDR